MSRPTVWRRGLLIALVLLVGAAAGTGWAAYRATASNGVNNFSAASQTLAIERAVVVKAAGGTAGTVRQGGDYHVYAEVTGSAPTVTADTSSFDAGVTAEGLTTAGGPWTIDGQSYAYRSAVLKADTPLATGRTHSYTVTASAGGTTINASYSAQIETYASVIAATSDLVSHWRFEDGAVSGDEFEGAAGTLITARSGAVGASWTAHAGSSRTALLTDAGRVRKETGNGAAAYYASGVPSSANYLVEADVRVQSLLASDAAAVTGRIDLNATGDTFYLARYVVDNSRWELLKVVNGTLTSLGTYAQTLGAGNTYRMTLSMSGTSIAVLIDGVQRIAATDSSIAGAGRGGLRLGTGSSTAQVTNTAGLHLDNFRITALGTTAADVRSANPGTYANGARLNQPGALVGSGDRAALLDGVNDHVVVSHSASVNVGDGPFTLEAWVKRSNANGGWVDVFQKGTNGYQFAFYNSAPTLAKDNCCALTGGGSVTDSGWHHLVAAKHGTTIRIFLDGSDVTGAISNSTLATTTSALYLGAKNGSSEFLAGLIDEFAIYNRVLTAAEVLDHYRAGTGTG